MRTPTLAHAFRSILTPGAGVAHAGDLRRGYQRGARLGARTLPGVDPLGALRRATLLLCSSLALTRGGLVARPATTPMTVRASSLVHKFSNVSI